MLEVAKSFPKRTALGWDAFHPRLMLLLGRPYAMRVAEILTAWEQHPQPSALFTTLVVFLAKPDGGWRPIGLMCFWLRLWGRLRRKYCAQWEADN